MKKRSGKTMRAKQRGGARSRRSSAGSRASSPNAVFLVGFMGAGKSSVGIALGRQLNWSFEDLDDRIQRREGRTVAEIFRDSGEPEFRSAEHRALQHVLDELRGGQSRIIALGGGAFVQKNNAALLLASKVPTVFLDAPVDELWRRCCEQAQASGAERPLLGSPEQFRKLFTARHRHYAKAAVRIDTGNRAVEAIAAEIAKMLRLKKIVIRTEEGEVE